jgi:hypothetical protein
LCWMVPSVVGDALRLDDQPAMPGSAYCLLGSKFIIQFELDVPGSPIDAIVLKGDGGVGQ